MTGQARNVRAIYRRFVSDGAYGTEGAEVSLECWVEGDYELHEDLEEADQLLQAAHDLVINRLLASNNARVRMAVQAARPTAPPSPAATVPDDEDERLPF